MNPQPRMQPELTGHCEAGLQHVLAPSSRHVSSPTAAVASSLKTAMGEISGGLLHSKQTSSSFQPSFRFVPSTAQELFAGTAPTAPLAPPDLTAQV